MSHSERQIEPPEMIIPVIRDSRSRRLPVGLFSDALDMEKCDVKLLMVSLLLTKSGAEFNRLVAPILAPDLGSLAYRHCQERLDP